MDFLQIALIFLIGLLAVFLTIAGVQVFFILHDLRKMLISFGDSFQPGESKAFEQKVLAIKKKVKPKNPKRRVFKIH